MTEQRLSDFLIIGAMRSGTTSLYRYVGAHPETFMLPKEFQFFTTHWDRGVDWYRAQFDGAGGAKVLGEATADYLARNSAMERIAETIPDVRLIASLRNPVDRAWSHFGLLEARGKESRTFTKAIDEELRIISTDGAKAPGLLYLSHGLYDAHLGRCLQLFGPDQLHVVLFEDMVADPGGIYREICSFLGIDSSIQPSNLGQVVNAYITFRSLRARAFTKKLPKGMARFVGRLNTKRGVAPSMLPADHERLTEFYRDRITATESILGRQLDVWRS